MDRARMQLRPRGTRGMFRAAARACVAAGAVFVVLTVLAAAYERALEKYAVLTGLTVSTGQGKTTLQFSFDPKPNAEPQQQQEQLTHTEAVTGGDDQPFLSRYFPLSLSFSKTGVVDSEGVESKPGLSSSLADQGEDSNADNISANAGADAHQGELEPKSHEFGFNGTVDFSGDNDPRYYELPSLKLQFLGNGSKDVPAEIADDDEVTFPSARFTAGRGLDKNATPPMGLSAVLLALLLAIMVVVLVTFLLVAFQHATVLGVIAYSVASTYMGKPVRFRNAARAGFKSGMVRLMWLAVLHGVLRGLQCLFFIRAFLRSTMALEDVESLVMRLSLMPFAFLAPFKDKDIVQSGMGVQVAAFLAVDYVFEGLAYAVYIVACWVTIMEADYRGVRALQRSWNLVVSMQWQAITIKVLEGVICGRSCEWLLQQALGQYASALIIAGAEIYFTVLWLVFYFAARCKQEQPRFSHRNLEEFLDKVR